MHVGLFLKIKGSICILFAIAALIAPGFAAGLYGIQMDFSGLYFGQLFGATFLAIGLICWLASGAPGSELKGNLLLALAIADTVGTGFTLYHQVTGPINALGWFTVILWAVFAAGCWLFRTEASTA